jgi:hypothetical protein
VVIVTCQPPLAHTRAFANTTNALFRSFLKMSPSRSATILYAKILPPLGSPSQQSEQMHWLQFVYRMTIWRRDRLQLSRRHSRNAFVKYGVWSGKTQSSGFRLFLGELIQALRGLDYALL